MNELQVSNRIKEIRKNLNFSQSLFADMLNVTRSHISKIESGKVSPSNQLIKSICREYGIRERWLREGQGSVYEKLDLSKFEQLKLDLEIAGYESAAESFHLANITLKGTIDLIKHIPGFKIKSSNQAAIKFLEEKKFFQKTLHKLQKIFSERDSKEFRRFY